MSAPQPCCKTLFTWLKANLGKRCLAPLTGTDAKALTAAVHIIELYSYCDSSESDNVAKAFGLVVANMQLSTRHLAFHAIAHMMEWDTRWQLWELAGLPPLDHLPRCSFEPGGPMIDLSKK